MNKNAPFKPYVEISNLWVSLATTSFAAILNAIFITVILSHKSVFMLYSASSKLGTHTNLLTVSETAFMTTATVAVSLLVSGVVAILVILKQRAWLRFVILLQIAFIGIGISNIVESVIRIQAGTEFISYIGSGVVILLSVVSIVLYLRFVNPQISKVTKRGKKTR